MKTFSQIITFLLLISCGAENLPKQLEEMDETAKKNSEWNGEIKRKYGKTFGALL